MQTFIFYIYFVFYYFFDKILVCTGTAWLSSVRVVKCYVNSFNGRNPWF